MERTQPHIVHAAFAQGNKFRYHINNVGGIQYLLYGKLVYHENLISGWDFKNTKKSSIQGQC